MPSPWLLKIFGNHRITFVASSTVSPSRPPAFPVISWPPPRWSANVISVFLDPSIHLLHHYHQSARARHQLWYQHIIWPPSDTTSVSWLVIINVVILVSRSMSMTLFQYSAVNIRCSQKYERGLIYELWSWMKKYTTFIILGVGGGQSVICPTGNRLRNKLGSVSPNNVFLEWSHSKLAFL